MAGMLCSAVLLTGTACGNQVQENINDEQQVQELQKITVGEVAHSIFYAPSYAAMSLGYFEEEGLEVDLVNLQGADKVMTAMISDEIQIGLAGPEANVYTSLQNLEDRVVIFAQLTQRDGSFLVGREPIENFSLEMLGELERAEIIGGRAGGAPEMTLEYVLKTNGLDIGVDDESKPVNVRTDIQFAAMGGSFLSGEGDFVTLFEPTATQFEKEGKGYILTAIGAHCGNIPFTAYSAAQSYIDANPDVIQRFTNAVYKGQQYVATHSAEEIAPLVQPYFEDISLEDMVTVVQRYKDIEAWDITPVLEPEALEKLMDVMTLAGQLEERAAYSDIVTTEFAEKAIETVKFE
ncbi:MAG: ABC transporter substrate-binding protein [Peptococcaceae bacterium]|nr:ABC transporter substrate-binding protein [Peptococcaceae bacterium]